MTGEVVLALTGSNLTGDVPFSCALALPAGVVGARSEPGRRGDLAQMVAQLCAAHGVPAAAVTELRLDVGPGSYTGLRVAVTFARFLQQFGGVRVLALDSLALLANRVGASTPGEVRVLLDARRERVHVQGFRVQPDRVLPLAAAAARPFAEVLAEVRGGDVVVAPAALPAPMLAALRAAGADVQEQGEVVAAEMFAPRLPFAPAAAADLEPRYLMGSYAEG